MFDLNPVMMLIRLPGILIGLTFHEFAHAFLAVKMGDDTPIQEGRYTLNPIRHIDFIGLILILTAGFGWAKPVRFNPNNLKNPRLDENIISLAGPLTNFVCAIVITGLLKLLIVFVPEIFRIQLYGQYILQGFLYAILINLILGIFNLIPIPPLDGSHILLSFIPDRYYQFKANLVQYGSFILIAIILVDNFSKINILPIGPLTDWFFQILMKFIIK
jgi:Zn-dependent protease